MKLQSLKPLIPKEIFEVLKKENIKELRPSQAEAIKKDLLKGKNFLICTPTASGKTLIAELAGVKSIIEGKGKTVYIVPLKALASEKYKDFKKKYSHLLKVALSIGDLDASDPYLSEFDLIITTSEKFDSLLRHHIPWINNVKTLVVDEVHLLNDPGRGPTLEILITMLREILKNIQVIALSATIGNPKELAAWLKADLIIDDWRPIKLHKGLYYKGEIEF